MGKIHGQRNVFKGIPSNPIYCGIWIATFIAQILIVQFGGQALSTAPLDWDHWGWCILFGIGTLVWQQLLITIPIECIRMPKFLSKTKLNIVDIDSIEKSEEHGNEEADFETQSDLQVTEPRSGKVLWMRGVTRIQTQLRVVDAFRSPLEAMEDKRSISNVSMSPQSNRYYL